MFNILHQPYFLVIVVNNDDRLLIVELLDIFLDELSHIPLIDHHLHTRILDRRHPMH